MKNIVLIIWLSVMCFSLRSQEQPVHYCIYGDTLTMQKTSSGFFWELKEGIPDGLWVVYYNEALKDTAIVVPVINGLMEGHYRFWFIGEDRLAEDAEYKRGKLNGIKKSYFYSEDGQKYTNIWLYEDDVVMKHVQIEF